MEFYGNCMNKAEDRHFCHFDVLNVKVILNELLLEFKFNYIRVSTYFIMYPVKSVGSVLFSVMLCGAFDNDTSCTVSLSENE